MVNNKNKRKRDKIVNIPITDKQRKLNEMGIGYVPCYVSKRWIQFETVTGTYDGKELIILQIMTIGKDGKPYKLLEMIIEKEDIIRVVDSLK